MNESILYARGSYDIDAIRKIELKAIENIPVYTLMERAAKEILNNIKKLKLEEKILVFCGPGNNGGDGHVVAYLAHKAKIKVKVIHVCDPNLLKGAAKTAYEKCKKAGVKMEQFSLPIALDCTCIVDALLGIGGGNSSVKGLMKKAIEAINAAKKFVISVDIPTGLNANSGEVMGNAVIAQQTVTFIGIKIGLLIGKGPDYSGELVFSDLGLEPKYYEGIPIVTDLLQTNLLKAYLPCRVPTSHKGTYGHLLIIGGDCGMLGSVILAGEAALRAGAGKVTIATHFSHANFIVNTRPELLILPIQDGKELKNISKDINAIVIGPGLGVSNWSKSIWENIKFNINMIIDASGLRLLADTNHFCDNWILTPHPGEASAMLHKTISVIQNNRIISVKQMQRKYGGTVVLKGAGTLVCSENNSLSICPFGNPGMATAGMGDVLSGIIGGLLAQGLSKEKSAQLGVLIHALAGDLVSLDGMRGLIASDLIPHIREFVNAK